MDEYHCDVTPIQSFDLNYMSSSCLGGDRYFRAEFNCTNMYVLSARRFRTSNVTQYHTFLDVTKEEMIQKTTIEEWLSQTDIPQDAYMVVESKILECLENMVKGTHKNSRIFPIRVDIWIPRASEDESSESEADEDEVLESSESDEDDEDDEDENEEDYMDDQEIQFAPAAKSCVENLEKVEKEGKCTICFEDFNVCLVMPCSHMYHPKCIRDWLEIGNSCPLCRFELPTRS